MLHIHLHYNNDIIRRGGGLGLETFSQGSEKAGALQIKVLPHGLLLFGAVNRFCPVSIISPAFRIQLHVQSYS